MQHFSIFGPKITQICGFSISFMHVTQWRIESVVTVSVSISRIGKNRVDINESKWTLQVLGGVYYPKFLQDASATRRPCSRTVRRLKLHGVYLRREYVTFVETPNTWPRIAQTKTVVRLHCFGCRSADDVLPATTHFCRGAPACEWGKLSQWFIDRSINERHRRMACVVQQQGKHIEILNWNETV